MLGTKTQMPLLPPGMGYPECSHVFLKSSCLGMRDFGIECEPTKTTTSGRRDQKTAVTFVINKAQCFKCKIHLKPRTKCKIWVVTAY